MSPSSVIVGLLAFTLTLMAMVGGVIALASKMNKTSTPFPPGYRPGQPPAPPEAHTPPPADVAPPGAPV